MITIVSEPMIACVAVVTSEQQHVQHKNKQRG